MHRLPESFVEVEGDLFGKLGNLESITYNSVNKEGKKQRYIHHFKEKSRPSIFFNSGGKKMRICGGVFKLTKFGIEG